MQSALVAVSDIEKMALAVCKSGLFGIKTADQAMALMLVAQAEGMHPAIAARDYHVIQGRPALKADAMLARFQQAGGRVEWPSYTDQQVIGKFSHPQGGSVAVEWTWEMAKKLGFDKKDNWKNYPRAMLRARCISEGIRTVYPGIAVGVYTPEEVQDFDNKPGNGDTMVNVTPQVDRETGEIIEGKPNGKAAYEAAKREYKIEQKITADGFIDFDDFAAGLEAELLKGGLKLNDVSMLKKANSQTLTVMRNERPDLYQGLVKTFVEVGSKLM